MKELDSPEVLRFLEGHQASGLHVDDRLLGEVKRPGKVFVFTLATVDEFLSLVWQSIDASRPLVPAGRPRTLRDCALRLSQFNWRFQALVQAGFTWFEKCVAIDADFDYSKIRWIALTPLIASEKRETPAGSHYIYDGVHKSIVLAKRVLSGQVDYAPVEALLLTPRRS